jgi:hypothetical protein
VDQICRALEPSTSRSRRTESKTPLSLSEASSRRGPAVPTSLLPSANGHSPPGPSPTLNDARHLPVSLRPGPAGDIGLPGCFARNGWATWTRALRWGRSCAYVPRDDASWPRSNRAAGLRCRIRSAQVTAPRRSHSVLTLRIGDAGWGTKGVDHWLGSEGCGLDAGKIRGWCAAGGERGIRGGGE